jgi:hypothetical protein
MAAPIVGENSIGMLGLALVPAVPRPQAPVNWLLAGSPVPSPRLRGADPPACAIKGHEINRERGPH